MPPISAYASVFLVAACLLGGGRKYRLSPANVPARVRADYLGGWTVVVRRRGHTVEVMPEYFPNIIPRASQSLHPEVKVWIERIFSCPEVLASLAKPAQWGRAELTLFRKLGTDVPRTGLALSRWSALEAWNQRRPSPPTTRSPTPLATPPSMPQPRVPKKTVPRYPYAPRLNEALAQWSAWLGLSPVEAQLLRFWVLVALDPWLPSAGLFRRPSSNHAQVLADVLQLSSSEVAHALAADRPLRRLGLIYGPASWRPFHLAYPWTDLGLAALFASCVPDPHQALVDFCTKHTAQGAEAAPGASGDFSPALLAASRRLARLPQLGPVSDNFEPSW